MIRAQPVLRLAVVFVALAMGACAGTGVSATPPRITLVDLRPTEIELFEQRFRLTLRVQNTSAEPIRITGLDFSVAVNGEDFASGVSSERIAIARYGESTIGVDVSSTLGRILEQFAKLGELEQPTLDYVIEGHVELEGGARMPYRFEDELTLFGSRRGIDRRRSI